MVGYGSVNAMDGLKSCDFYMTGRILAGRTDRAGFCLWQRGLGIALGEDFCSASPNTDVRMTSNDRLGFKMKKEGKAFPPSILAPVIYLNASSTSA